MRAARRGRVFLGWGSFLPTMLTLLAAACSDGTATPTPPPSGPTATQGLIAFASERDGNGEIYVMNADGTELERLTGDPTEDGDPAWSPAGAAS